MPGLTALRAPLTGLLAALLLISTPFARAADRANIEAFLDVTGFDVALDSIALTAADAPGMLGMEPGDFGQDWTRVTGEVFDTGTMRDMAVEILDRTLSDEMLAHAAEFYASPLGRKLVEAENASHMVPDSAAKQDEGAGLLDEARGTGRVDTLRRLNAAIDESGHAVKAVQEVMVRFLMAASHAGVLDYEIDEQSLRALLAGQEEEMRADMKKTALAGAAYTYRDLATEELAAYAEALEHPTMQRVYELMNAIQFEIMANRFEVLAARMAEMHPGQEL